MRVEHFVYGVFNGVGHRFVGSPHVHELVGHSSLNTLKKLTRSCQTLLPEQVVAVTHIEPRKDEYGRKGTWNHTILIPITQYFQLNPPTWAHHLKPTDKPPAKLEPLNL